MTLHQIISLSLVDPKKTSSVIVLVMVTWLVYHVLFQLVSHVFCFFGSSSSRLSLCAKIFPRPHMLGCTNAAKRPPHSRPTRRRASDAAACASVPHPVFFFSFPDSRRLGPICSDSGCIGPYRAKPPIRAEIQKKVRNAPSNVSRLSSAPLTLVSLCASSSTPPPFDN